MYTKSFIGLIVLIITLTGIAFGLSYYAEPKVYVAQSSTPYTYQEYESQNFSEPNPVHVVKTDARNEHWIQVSGDANDTCTNPKFTGNVPLKGWMVAEEAYFGGMMDFLKIPYPESEKLPWELLNAGQIAAERSLTKGPATVVVEDPTSSGLLAKLKAGSEANPVTFTVTEFSHYCEGWGVVKIK